MAREYKLVVTYLDATEASIFWHDDNDIEQDSIPSIESRDTAVKRLDIWQLMVDFARLNNVDHLHLKKV